ncbi:hypothetical protein VNI00_018995 [Paramarasmius palmivorus]|uniref:Nephrocystin 3-like N-terminal domain-containing protein n=1 Tax=Paramarasmius palmivorus TaxID=297713 RepID=A0AAW0ASW1_9AGAR
MFEALNTTYIMVSTQPFLALQDAHWDNVDDTTRILQKLADHTAPNATYYAGSRYPQPNCAPNTRVSILETLSSWIKKEKDQNIRVFWVNGSAGVGKSAIAQKISENSEASVVATFFFSRNDPTCDKLDRFVATLAYQCCTSPKLKDVVGPLIIDAIRSDPHIFQSSSENQLRKLLLEPFSKLTLVQRLDIPNLIVIDGLDECVDLQSQQRLLGMVDLVITGSTLSSFPFNFLLCSRRESNLRTAYDRLCLVACCQELSIQDTRSRFWRCPTGIEEVDWVWLSEGEKCYRIQTLVDNLQCQQCPDHEIQRLTGIVDCDLDIQKFLTGEFARLREELPALCYEDESWPTKGVIWNLVWRASGQFIFANTVINYLDTSDERPQDRLKIILRTESGALTDSLYPSLDMLYKQIMSTCHWEKVQPILRFLVTPHPSHIDVTEDVPDLITSHTPSIIKGIFQLQPGEVEMLLPKLHSVIHVPKLTDAPHPPSMPFTATPSEVKDLLSYLYSFKRSPMKIHILHASFTEFLLNKARSGNYHIQPYSRSEYCDLVAVLFLRTLSSYTSYYPSHCSSESLFHIMFYAWIEKVSSIRRWSLEWAAPKFWASYCYQVETPSVSLLAELDKVDPFMVGSIGDGSGIQILFNFRNCLQWAKLLKEKAPQVFIKKTEAFLDGFYLGLHRKSARRCAIHITYQLECGFSALYHEKGAEKVADFAYHYYNQWWKDRGSDDSLCPLIFPSNPYKFLPTDWIVIHITPRNSSRKLLERIYGIYKYLHKDAQRMFDDDVIYNTSRSVTRNLVKAKDLAAFKELLYERRDSFAGLAILPPLQAYIEMGNV